jgi:hypothetical protein
MNAENAEDLKDPETPPVQQAQAKPRKQKPRKVKKRTQTDDTPLPYLIELTYTISVLLLIFVGLAMIIVSVLTGASLPNLILRTTAAMLAMGSLVALIYHQVSSGVLQASRIEQEEAVRKQAEEPEVSEQPVAVEISESVEA